MIAMTNRLDRAQGVPSSGKPSTIEANSPNAQTISTQQLPSRFSIEYRGCFQMNEDFPPPGQMLPKHFTALAADTEKKIRAMKKKAVKKAAKLWQQGHLAFNSIEETITVVNSSDATTIATMPLLELLSFRVLKSQAPTLTEALLFAKHPRDDTLVAHRIVFNTMRDIASFHAKLRAEFDVVAKIAQKSTIGNTIPSAEVDTTKDVPDMQVLKLEDSASEFDDDTSSECTDISMNSRKSRYLFADIEGDDGALVISEAPVKRLSEGGSEWGSDCVEAEC